MSALLFFPLGLEVENCCILLTVTWSHFVWIFLPRLKETFPSRVDGFELDFQRMLTTSFLAGRCASKNSWLSFLCWVRLKHSTGDHSWGVRRYKHPWLLFWLNALICSRLLPLGVESVVCKPRKTWVWRVDLQVDLAKFTDTVCTVGLLYATRKKKRRKKNLLTSCSACAFHLHHNISCLSGCLNWAMNLDGPMTLFSTVHLAFVLGWTFPNPVTSVLVQASTPRLVCSVQKGRCRQRKQIKL